MATCKLCNLLWHAKIATLRARNCHTYRSRARAVNSQEESSAIPGRERTEGRQRADRGETESGQRGDREWTEGRQRDLYGTVCTADAVAIMDALISSMQHAPSSPGGASVSSVDAFAGLDAFVPDGDVQLDMANGFLPVDEAVMESPRGLDANAAGGAGSEDVALDGAMDMVASRSGCEAVDDGMTDDYDEPIEEWFKRVVKSKVKSADGAKLYGKLCEYYGRFLFDVDLARRFYDENVKPTTTPNLRIQIAQVSKALGNTPRGRKPPKDRAETGLMTLPDVPPGGPTGCRRVPVQSSANPATDGYTSDDSAPQGASAVRGKSSARGGRARKQRSASSGAAKTRATRSSSRLRTLEAAGKDQGGTVSEPDKLDTSQEFTASAPDGTDDTVDGSSNDQSEDESSDVPCSSDGGGGAEHNDVEPAQQRAIPLPNAPCVAGSAKRRREPLQTDASEILKMIESLQGMSKESVDCMLQLGLGKKLTLTLQTVCKIKRHVDKRRRCEEQQRELERDKKDLDSELLQFHAHGI